MNTATEKFEWIEAKGKSLCDWFTQFLYSGRKDFLLEIAPPGDIGVWRWTGEDIKIPAEKSWELGEFMTGLRSCLDIAVYQVSTEAVRKGLVRRSGVRFPILRSSNSWTKATASWLSESNRQRVRQAQRFGKRRSYDVDIVLINALANCDKHRSIVRIAVSSASCGQIGGKNSISFARAKDLGLGPVDSQGWYTGSTTQGFRTGKSKKGQFVTGGPLGGLALTGTIPTMELRIANDLELDDEDDKKRLARVSVVEAITQAMDEVREILAILGEGTVQVTRKNVSDTKYSEHKDMLGSAAEMLQIYQNIPIQRELRLGWSMHLKQLGSRERGTN